jgi:RHS repeat-associated protein
MQKSTFTHRTLFFLVTLLLSVSLHRGAFADVGDANPTGVTGIYNGNVTTAGNYDPYTRNAMREVDDIVVQGSVGAYPLKWTRYFNSRGNNSKWTFSYNDYGINDGRLGGVNHISFPDGRDIGIDITGDSCLTGGISDQQSSALDENNVSWPAILMIDGGQVLFTTWIDSTGTNNFAPIEVVDPYGQRTMIHYVTPHPKFPNGDDMYRMDKITEPGGRYLQITWDSTYSRILKVEAYDGRGTLLDSVQYTWTQGAGQLSAYMTLTQATYADGNVATYTYTKAANGSSAFRPVLQTCQDVRFNGPMRNIGYTYQAQADGTPTSRIKSENHLNNGVIAEMVSSVNDPGDGSGAITLTETRGDNATRTFSYAGKPTITACAENKAKLLNYTDFQAHTTTVGYNECVSTFGGNCDGTDPYNGGFVSTVTDPNNHITSYTRDYLGAVTRITYADGSVVDQTYTNANNSNPNNNPFFLTSRTLPHDPVTINPPTIFYTRNPVGGANPNVITRKDYPDGGWETFAYNTFGEVTSHSRAQDATHVETESFQYDTRGLKTQWTDAAGKITQYSYYGPGDPIGGNKWVDRLKTITHPPNASGQIATETFEYDRDPTTGAVESGRGLVTKITYADGSLSSKTYNKYGDVLTSIDELGHTTTKTYDDYGRVLTTTDPLNHTTSNDYTPTGKTSSYITTSMLPFKTTLPSTKATTFEYDPNWRKTWVHQAPGTGDAANTRFIYDVDATRGYTSIGNLVRMIDPNGKATTYNYDSRDREVSVTDALNHTTSCGYDKRGLKTVETHSNTEEIDYDGCDAMYRLTHKSVHRDASTVDTTSMSYDLAGNQVSFADEDGQAPYNHTPYSYQYDAMNRRTKMVYPGPSPAPNEATAYDAAGNVSTYTTRTGKVQTFAYDNRNRELSFYWSDAPTTGPRTIVYDAASRKTNVNNANATITFTYNDDNTVATQEEVEINGSIPDGFHRIVSYHYDADGNRDYIIYPSGKRLNYAYTQRNEMNTITLNGQPSPIVTYTFDPTGNITKRTLDNGTSSTYAPNAVNLDASVEHDKATTMVHRFDYVYNSVNDVLAVERDSNLADADGYKYDLTQQITEYQQKGTANMSTGIVTNPATDDAMKFDGCGNRQDPNAPANTGAYVANVLNQYTTFNNAAVGSDTNGNVNSYNGYIYVYDSQNRLLTANNTTAGLTSHFYYDGLNRQIARRIAVNGVSTTVFSVWDGDWALLEEYAPSNVLMESYVGGYHGMVKTLVRNIYYYQDELGSTSHIASSTGVLLESYRYDLCGKPKYYDASGNLMSGATTQSAVFLFTGGRWMPEIGLYDYRNRFMSPDLQRFLQPDPIGFKGDASNIYRYCGNDWANRSDPTGLSDAIGNVNKPASPYVPPAACNTTQNGFVTTIWFRGIPPQIAASMAPIHAEAGGSPQRSSISGASLDGGIGGGALQISYITYGGKWTPEDGGRMREAWAQDPGLWNQLASDNIEHVVVPAQQGDKKGFNVVTDYRASAAMQGSGNFEKMPRGDNTSANAKARAAADEVELSTAQRNLFHRSISKQGYKKYDDLRAEALRIKNAYPNAQ